ncbi:carbohydrate ABC transporter permease [Leifsonia poae]|uniref:carbohydrate ABC transporter permease n=1 Tax=Leifsonia poae TaxID=110933 RepID=UPI003D66C6CA
MTLRARTAAASNARVRSRRLARVRIWLTAAAFLLPALIGLLILRIIPTVEAIGTSLTNKVGTVSFSNFGYVFTDPTFLNALKVTLLFSIVINPIQIALALWLAVVLTKRVPGVGIWRTLILLPIAVPQIVSAIVWGVLFRPDGPINGILESLGIAPVPWLVSPSTALLSIMIICTWVGVGYWMTFLVAGIKDIPSSLYEASELDGAGGWKQFLYITLPGLRRPLLFVLVADTVANFLVFAPVRILTQGGPQGSTNLIMNFIFERAYVLADPAGAAAATIVLVLIVVCVVGVQFRLLPGKD